MELREYATKEISATMEAFADFVIAEVYGGNLPKGVDEATLRKGIALGGSLRTPFQKSDFWKGDPRNYLANVEANRERKANERAERAKEQAAKAVARANELAEKAKVASEAAAAKAKALSEAAA